MSELNVEVEGFVATDPVQGTTQAGKPYLQVSVAHNERRKNQQTGQWENATDRDGNEIVSWVRATFWEDEATTFASQLSKGTLVLLRGRGRVTAYTDKGGVARGQLEILWPKLSLVARKQAQGASQGAQQGGFGGQSAQQPQQAWNEQPGGGGFDDEQPF